MAKIFYYKNVNTKYTIKWLINNNFGNTITIFTITITLFTNTKAAIPIFLTTK